MPPRTCKRDFKGHAIETGDYCVFVCPDNHIHIMLSKVGDPPGDIAFDADEAYEFAAAINRGVDVAVGIVDPRPRPPSTE